MQYTIFINEKPLYLTDKFKKTLPHYLQYKYEENHIFDEALNSLTHSTTPEIYIYCSDIKTLWHNFKKHFKVIKAAGGIVKNDDEQLLLIKRFNKWDLPKGKMEKGEDKTTTALREVEEECNLKKLTIGKKAPTTYHIYFTNQPILKIVYWYEMFCDSTNQTLKPQLEEGIEEVIWLDKAKIPTIFKNTYQNIIYLLKKSQ